MDLSPPSLDDEEEPRIEEEETEEVAVLERSPEEPPADSEALFEEDSEEPKDTTKESNQEEPPEEEEDEEDEEEDEEYEDDMMAPFLVVDDHPNNHNKSQSAEKYLIPHLIFGPNNQFHGFKEAMVMARLLNRTLVLPRILAHYTQSAENTAEIYEFEQVLNRDLVSRYVKIISLKDFLAESGGILDVLWRTRVKKMFRAYEGGFFLVQDLKFRTIQSLWSTQPHSLTTVRFTSPEQLREALFDSPERFVGISCFYGALVSPNAPLEIRSPFQDLLIEAGKFVEFVPFYRSLAAQVLPSITKSLNFACIHFRMDEREEECDRDAHDTDDLVCFGLGKPYYTLNTTCFIADLEATLKQEKFEEVYLATSDPTGKFTEALDELPFPVKSHLDLTIDRITFENLLEQNDWILRSRKLEDPIGSGIATGNRPVISRKLNTQELAREKYHDINDAEVEMEIAGGSGVAQGRYQGHYVPLPEGDTVRLHEALPPFALSIIEEEICAEARRFIGTRQSTWTRFVVARRMGVYPERAEGDSDLDGSLCTQYHSTRVN